MIELNEGKEKVSELLEFLYSFLKIADNYSDDPIQMGKELNNLYYINNEKLIDLADYFNSIENSFLPPSFLNNYFNNGWVLRTGNLGSTEDFDIIRSNLGNLASLRLPNNHSNPESNNKGIEKGSLGKVLERIKQEKILEGASKKTKYVYKKSNKVGIQLPDLPKDLKWEEITIRFLNGDEVLITVRELVYQTSFESMGFKDQKTKNPNLQWKFLKALSLINGFLNWDNNKKLTTKERNNAKKRKQELSESLKIYFTIKDDPFLDYKKERGYKIKIQLIPEQGSDIKETIKPISNNIYDYSEDEELDTQDSFDEKMSDSWN